MRNRGRWVAALAAGVLLAGPLAADGGLPPALANFAVQSLLLNEGVQKELGLSDDQVKKVKQALPPVWQKYRKKFQALRQVEPRQRDKKVQEAYGAMAREGTEAMLAQLTDEQVRRLRQIELQERGLRAFDDPEVEKALGLTRAQRQGLTKIGEEAGKEMRKLFEGTATFEQTEKKRVALRKKVAEQVLALFTEDQQKAWKELTGEPFVVEYRRPSPPPAAGPKQARGKE